MSADLNSGWSVLGTLSSSLYLGGGIMQVPGGILAAKWGPKRTVSLGILVSSIAVLGTSISSAILEVATLRFIVGAGMALVFAPSVVIMTRFLGGKSGTGVGLINSAFDIGGLFGLFGWILLATFTGWRSTLVLSGGLGLLTGLLVIALVPKDGENVQFRFSTGQLGKILSDRNLIVLGLGSLGSNLGSVLISSFMAYYLQASLAETAAIAGIVAAMIVVLPIYTSLWGGRMYDRTRKPRRLLILSGLGMTSALLVAAVPRITGSSSSKRIPPSPRILETTGTITGLRMFLRKPINSASTGSENSYQTSRGSRNRLTERTGSTMISSNVNWHYRLKAQTISRIFCR